VSSYNIFMALILMYIRRMSIVVCYLSFLELLLNMLPFSIASLCSLALLPVVVRVCCLNSLYVPSLRIYLRTFNVTCDKYHVILNMVSYIRVNCYFHLHHRLWAHAGRVGPLRGR
jgi:hypothetical protein